MALVTECNQILKTMFQDPSVKPSRQVEAVAELKAVSFKDPV